LFQNTENFAVFANYIKKIVHVCCKPRIPYSFNRIGINKKIPFFHGTAFSELNLNFEGQLRVHFKAQSLCVPKVNYFVWISLVRGDSSDKTRNNWQFSGE
jgi:hypothetical protein